MVVQRFHSFVIFAEMRTGSNFLERNLNAVPGIACLGEVFNPHFIGHPNTKEVLGYSQRQREARPDALLDAMRSAPEITGFRYFHDHDPRILDRLITDDTCAKIMLTRDSVDSFVSWKIAQTTGQWQLTDIKRRRAAKVTFDPVEFSAYTADVRQFRHEVIRRLQAAGQVAFPVAYNDLQSLDVINGVARYLGAEKGLAGLDQKLKVQNPSALADLVTNADVLEAALHRQNTRDLTAPPDVEPQRVAVVPTYILGAHTPLIYMPVRGGPVTVVAAWMAALDGVEIADLPTGLTQRELRQWKRTKPGHRSFTVIRHPVVRAHYAFCQHILGMGQPEFTAIRRTLIKRYNVPVPPDRPDSGYSLAQHRAGFKAFLQFLQPNLNGQTAVRIDPAWCSQTQAISGFGNMALPDMILREEEMESGLRALTQQVGRAFVTPVQAAPDRPFRLEDIYDDEIESLCAAAYHRDYMTFGFAPWRT